MRKSDFFGDLYHLVERKEKVELQRIGNASNGEVLRIPCLS
jgi:hypothetical protein